MTSPLYFLLLIVPAITGIILAIIFYFRKKNAHTGLYSQGVYNENNGQYDLALHNYEDALKEIKNRKPGNKFFRKIVEKIKTLRTIISYEKNFHNDDEAACK